MPSFLAYATQHHQTYLRVHCRIPDGTEDGDLLPLTMLYTDPVMRSPGLLLLSPNRRKPPPTASWHSPPRTKASKPSVVYADPAAAFLADPLHPPLSLAQQAWLSGLGDGIPMDCLSHDNSMRRGALEDRLSCEPACHMTARDADGNAPRPCDSLTRRDANEASLPCDTSTTHVANEDSLQCDTLAKLETEEAPFVVHLSASPRRIAQAVLAQLRVQLAVRAPAEISCHAPNPVASLPELTLSTAIAELRSTADQMSHFLGQQARAVTDHPQRCHEAPFVPACTDLPEASGERLSTCALTAARMLLSAAFNICADWSPPMSALREGRGGVASRLGSEADALADICATALGHLQGAALRAAHAGERCAPVATPDAPLALPTQQAMKLLPLSSVACREEVAGLVTADDSTGSLQAHAGTAELAASLRIAASALYNAGAPLGIDLASFTSPPHQACAGRPIAATCALEQGSVVDACEAVCSLAAATAPLPAHFHVRLGVARSLFTLRCLDAGAPVDAAVLRRFSFSCMLRLFATPSVPHVYRGSDPLPPQLPPPCPSLRSLHLEESGTRRLFEAVSASLGDCSQSLPPHVRLIRSIAAATAADLHSRPDATTDTSSEPSCTTGRATKDVRQTNGEPAAAASVAAEQGGPLRSVAVHAGGSLITLSGPLTSIPSTMTAVQVPLPWPSVAAAALEPRGAHPVAPVVTVAACGTVAAIVPGPDQSWTLLRDLEATLAAHPATASGTMRDPPPTAAVSTKSGPAGAAVASLGASGAAHSGAASAGAPRRSAGRDHVARPLSAAALAQFLYLPLSLQLEVLEGLGKGSGLAGFVAAAETGEGRLVSDDLLRLRAEVTSAILHLFDAW
jgi:hypothetical protein